MRTISSCFGRSRPGSGRPVGRWWRRALTTAGREDGAIAVEFALLAPLLLIIVFGIIQFGYAFYIQISMTNSVREAARALAVGSANVGGASTCATANTGTAEAVACTGLAGLFVTDFTITACSPTNNNASLCPLNTDVGVWMTIPRSSIALGDLLGFFDTGNMSAYAIMRIEGGGRAP